MRERRCSGESIAEGADMGTLLSIIVLWLSLNFALPANYEHPRVVLVPAERIVSIRYRGLATERPDMTPNQTGPRSVVAVYDDRTRTIYLRDDWKGATPAELSILVHEMVHHLQNLARLRYACPQEREALAFAAQQRWLQLFGGSLERDFEIDGLTLLVGTRCAY
jgi:hypothetical protein